MANNRPMIYCCLIAIFFSLLMLLAPNDLFMLSTSIFTLTGSLFGLSTFFKNPIKRINFFQLTPSIVLLSTSASIIVSYFVFTSESYKHWLYILEYSNTTDVDLTLAQAYICLFAVILVNFNNVGNMSLFCKNINSDVSFALNNYKKYVLLFTLLICCSQVYLFNAGVVVYGGGKMSELGAANNPLMSIIIPFIPLIPFACSQYLKKDIANKRYLNILVLLLILAIELGWFFLHGRRSIMFFSIMMFFGYFFNVELTATFLLKRIIPLLFFTLSSLYIADTYHKIRAVFGYTEAQQISINNSLRSIDQLNQEDYKALRNENLSTRVSYTTMIFARFVNFFRTSNQPHLHGEDLYNQILSSTPSNYIVDKTHIKTVELLYNEKYGLNLEDISDSIILGSYIDFGLMGLLIYNAFLIILFYMIYFLMNSIKNPLYSLLGTCMILYCSLTMIENNIITVLTYIRTLLILYPIFCFLGSFKKFSNTIKSYLIV